MASRRSHAVLLSHSKPLLPCFSVLCYGFEIQKGKHNRIALKKQLEVTNPHAYIYLKDVCKYLRVHFSQKAVASNVVIRDFLQNMYSMWQPHELNSLQAEWMLSKQSDQLLKEDKRIVLIIMRPRRCIVKSLCPWTLGHLTEKRWKKVGTEKWYKSQRTTLDYGIWNRFEFDEMKRRSPQFVNTQSKIC